MIYLTNLKTNSKTSPPKGIHINTGDMFNINEFMPKHPGVDIFKKHNSERNPPVNALGFSSNVPFWDFGKVNEKYFRKLIKSFKGIVKSGQYINGPALKKFEKNFANYCGTEHCIGVGNGTDALSLILEAYQFKPGSEIIVPAKTFIATPMAVSRKGLKPVFVDVDESTFNINPKEIEKAITDKTKAIMPVHLFGQVAPMKEINGIAQKYSLKVIEDSAQAHGACLNGKKTGNLGDAAAFSFHPSKNLGAIGSGGCITTNNKELAQTIRKLRHFGAEPTGYEHNILGENSKLDDIQAEALNIKMKYLDKDNGRRREIANYYLNNIKNDKIMLPEVPDDEMSHVWFFFVLKTKDKQTRDALQTHLLNKGIGTAIHYSIPTHKEIVYKDFNNLRLPVTEKLSERVLSLPNYPALKNGELKRVVKAVNEF